MYFALKLINVEKTVQNFWLVNLCLYQPKILNEITSYYYRKTAIPEYANCVHNDPKQSARFQIHNLQFPHTKEWRGKDTLFCFFT